MTFKVFLDCFLDSLLDSLIVLGICFVIHFILSFFELQAAKRLKKSGKYSPLLGSLLGLVPECGTSVIGSDLYIKEHITMGTLVAIFLSCSDEAIPLMLSSHDKKSLMAFVLIALKFVIGFAIGYLVDLVYRKRLDIKKHLEHCDHEDEIHDGCCHHHIDDENEGWVHKHLIHPLVHSLKIFLYVFVINLIFSLIISLIGEETIMNFIKSSKYLSPLFSCIIGLIPNCASSVLITELYILDGISFGACLSGLLMNSGLGLIYLLKEKSARKKALMIIGICFITSVLFGYLTCLIVGF